MQNVPQFILLYLRKECFTGSCFKEPCSDEISLESVLNFLKANHFLQRQKQPELVWSQIWTVRGSDKI